MVCTHPDSLAIICKLLERKIFGLICFPRICFRRLIYCDQEPLLLLNVTEDYFFGCTYKAMSTRYKICFTPKSLWLFSQKSHECALKLTDLWNTKLLFDLSCKFINGSFAFSCG